MSTSQVIYASRASRHVDRTELADIAAAAAANNAALGVTGALLFCDGYFLQILEGPRAVLGPLVEKIGRDRRHAGLQVIGWYVGVARLFPAWSMACLHESTMTPVEFARATGWTRLADDAAHGRGLGGGARGLLLELRAAIAAEATRVDRGAA